jgi:hypothetical protein
MAGDKINLQSGIVGVHLCVRGRYRTRSLGGLLAVKIRYRAHKPCTRQLSLSTPYHSQLNNILLKGIRHASFCAEKIAFIIGMYEEDKSGETERIKMRGS